MMKRLIVVLSLVAGLSLVAPAADANASSGIESSWSWTSRSVGGWSWSWSSIISWLRQTFGSTSSGETTPSGNGSAVPELDPSAAGSALVLLIGGAAYLTSRRREEEEQA
ncbi:MAG: hypothetical protein WAU39_14295 [Polyangiales bacterium]